MKTHRLTSKSIYHAFLELTETEKRKFAEKISNLFRSKPGDDQKNRNARDKWDELEKLMSKLRKGLPIGYKFDRDEANAR